MHNPNRIKDHRRRNAGHSAFYAKVTADRRLIRQTTDSDAFTDNPDGSHMYITRSLFDPTISVTFQTVV